jgi:hypothetical protein
VKAAKAAMTRIDQLSPESVVIERVPADDPRAWTELVALLADLLYPANPEDSGRR